MKRYYVVVRSTADTLAGHYWTPDMDGAVDEARAAFTRVHGPAITGTTSRVAVREGNRWH